MAAARRHAKIAVDPTCTEKQAKAEHARLHAELTEHDKRYYQDDKPTVTDAEYDALRKRYGAIEAALSRSAHAGKPDAESRRRADRALRQGAPRGADALARQRVLRRGRDALRRPHPPLPQARCRRAARVHRRAEDRRAVDVAALRGRQARQRGDARRRRGRRGRHRQHQDAEGRAAAAQGQGHSGDRRGARRGLHDQGRLPRAERAAEGGGQGALRQSAQHRGRLAAAEGCQHHGVAAAALLRLCVGADERDAGGDAVRHGEVARRRCGFHDQSADASSASRPRSCSRFTTRSGSQRGQARLRHRRRRLQGRPARLAGAAGLRLAQPALGDRAQVSRRAGDDVAARTSRSRSGAPARSRRSRSWSRSASAA